MATCCHAGETCSCARRVTAEELRSMDALARNYSGETIPVMLQPHETIVSNRELLAHATDEQVRAECRRRGMRFEGAPESALRERVAACDRALDELKAKYATACDQIQALRDECDGYNCPRTAEVEDERDGWRRRAEAAETLAEQRLNDLLRLDRSDALETGPGIAATKPDNSVAWLDEDLLCEDVG